MPHVVDSSTEIQFGTFLKTKCSEGIEIQETNWLERNEIQLKVSFSLCVSVGREIPFVIVAVQILFKRKIIIKIKNNRKTIKINTYSYISTIWNCM